MDIKDKNITIKYDGSIISLSQLRVKYLSSICYSLCSNTLFVSMIKDKYNLPITNSLSNSDMNLLYSSFDNEIKQSAMSIEKILQNLSYSRYEMKFYYFNMKDRIKDIANDSKKYKTENLDTLAEDNEIDALSGATITTNAMTNAVNSALLRLITGSSLSANTDFKSTPSGSLKKQID